MHVRFLLGPAGSGKTFRCLTEVRHALTVSQEGAPLLLIAPKQTTYQLERQLLAYPSIPGYTRLHILSFERLAHFVLDRLGKGSPGMVDEEGRVMVLRALLARKRDHLKLFRASARLTGFAQQLSLVLRELQRNQLTPETLVELAGRGQEVDGLSYKLQDLGTLLQDYLNWLQAHRLQDADCLLSAAALALSESPTPRPLEIGGIWVDGFAEIAETELDLLAEVMPCAGETTLTFCLDRVPAKTPSWLSNWAVAGRTFEACRKRLAAVSEEGIAIEVLSRQPNKSRFLNNPVLLHLEEHWGAPCAWNGAEGSQSILEKSLRVAVCSDREGEATEAAREILRHVRAGGRYRDATVLVRHLEDYHQPLQRVFSRYGIPFFLDRREPVAHHPLAELTRNGLRTVTFQWQGDDWFAALKTGLLPVEEHEVDELENEALARGWHGALWQKPIRILGTPRSPSEQQQLLELEQRLERTRLRLLPPFEGLSQALAACQNKPSGPELAAALRGFWAALKVEEQLEAWAADEVGGGDSRLSGSVHATVWEQMNTWLANIELAFATESLPLREWLPILEAGLTGLTVGVIPPALDQVLIGAIDRSRNPDIRLAIVLGFNETVFPAQPETTALLSETDRTELEKRSILRGATARQQLSRERYLAYIACTRARERVVLTCAQRDANGSPLNPSPFLSRVQELFPTLRFETISGLPDWRESEHATELVGVVLRNGPSRAEIRNPRSEIREQIEEEEREPWRTIPALAAVMEGLRHLRNPEAEESLAPALAERLYGPVLHTSVSRMEQFAACPFKFFVHSGMRAEERKRFELDVKEQGSFQHDVLALFHEQLRSENKRWRDITPQEGRERVAKIAGILVSSYREGLLEASEETRFMARTMIKSLEDFVETQVAWMRSQYRFDPVRVELPFGDQIGSPAWAMELEDGHRLELFGRIDRVDLFRDSGSDMGYCVVVDYKSSQKKLDSLLMAHGLQLQLLTYLNVMRRCPDPREQFGVGQIVPAGVFYVSLRGKYEHEANRTGALEDAEQTRKLAYRHAGRFDAQMLQFLDGRSGATQGDQFNYRLTKNGQVHKGSREALSAAEFKALLESIEENLKKMGMEIFSGQAKVAPYRKGTTTACEQCDYRAVCRIDPWTHHYRMLRADQKGAAIEQGE